MHAVMSRSVARCECVPVKPYPISPSTVRMRVPTTPQCVTVCVESEIESAFTGICRMNGSTDWILKLTGLPSRARPLATAASPACATGAKVQPVDLYEPPMVMSRSTADGISMAATGVPSRSGGRMKSQRRQVGSTSGLRLPQVEPMRLYRQIASLISDRIDEGVFPVGSLLPAERDLAERLGVSRTSV